MEKNIQKTLEKILPGVTNPGRYIGGEANSVVKPKSTLLADMALVFPDVYEIGMSHNGTKVLYHLINREPDLAAERAFAPWTDMATAMRNHQLPLYSLESYRPINSFSTIGISLQTELNFTNVPYVLELSGVPSFARDRKEEDPFVVGGGPCMANPEPVADFYDIFVIGDGEGLVVEILKIIGNGRKNKLSRKNILQQLSELKGIYIPQLFPMIKNSRNEWVPETDSAKGSYQYSKGIKRHWVEVLNKNDYPVKNIVPNMNLVHDRFSIEVIRGCTQGCRFCQAGYWYRPNRELNPDEVIDIAKEGLMNTGERTLGLLSLSTADYSQAENVTNYLLKDAFFGQVDLSLPSLRANSYGQSLAAKVGVMSNSKSATFAPETGSERVRKIINKTISDQDMYNAAESMFSNGYHNIKLYTMVGLPTENMDDMKAFCGLIENLATIGKKYSSKNTIHPNIGIFIPKPFTPFQWVGFMPKEKVMNHINYVREYFRGNKNVRITWSDWDLAHVEAFYSRGDRSLSEMIYAAYKKGMVFESFSEGFNYPEWNQIWTDYQWNSDSVFLERELDEIFPWDFIHAGISKGYLKAEYKKSLAENSDPVPDCKWGDCQRCGIPGSGPDTKLASAPEKYVAPVLTLPELKELSHTRKRAERIVHRYQLLFKKTGLSKFLPHHSMLDIFEKAMRRLQWPVNYSQGFNIRPVVKNLGALPLGMSSDCEFLHIEFTSQLPGDATKWAHELSIRLPEGMDVISIVPVGAGKLPKIKSTTFVISDDYLLTDEAKYVYQQAENEKFAITIYNRDKSYQLSDILISSTFDHGEVKMVIESNESGAALSPYAIASALFKCPIDVVRTWGIHKLSVGIDMTKHVMVS